VSESREALIAAIGVELPDELLTLTLTHRSYAYEHGGLPTNERLEFLGDAVLGLTITDELFHRHPERSEGDLAKLRASIVNTHALAEVARNLTDEGLGAYLLLGRGEENTGGSDKSSILADGMESLLGAVYLHHGIDIARDVILRLFGALLDTAPTLGAGLDWKTSLQELTAARGLGVPSYVVTSTGPDHDKQFTATVVVMDTEYGEGIGRSKKEAEQKAAAAAWTVLDTADARSKTDTADARSKTDTADARSKTDTADARSKGAGA
jgi:ribonuclease III